METASPRARSIRFDVFEVDLVARELIKKNRRVRVQELPFKLLAVLLERPGETVTREELRNRLWGPAAVEFDDGLHTAVRKLREVLGDSATRPRFIETVPRRGYRFIAEVSFPVEAPADVGKGMAVIPEPAELVPALPIAEAAGRRRAGFYIYPAVGLLLLAVTAAVLVFMRRPAKSYYRAIADGGEAVPIAAEQGVQRSPALSPDNTRVAFTWPGESGHTPHLYVQNLDGTGRTRLTNDSAPDRFPAWSPDGRTIAFLRESEVFLIPAAGGAQRRLTTAAGDGLAWSSDARMLALSDGDANNASLSLYTVTLETGQRRRLTFPALKEQDVWPAYTRQGDTLAFVRRTTTTHDIYRMSLGGGEPVRLATPGRPLSGLAWTPDGAFVLAATGRQAPGLFVVPASAHDQRDPQRLDIAGSDVYEPSVVARNGGAALDLAFGHEVSNWDILGSPLPSGNVVPQPLITSIRNDQAPSFSPDGQHLAFNSARSGYEEIWVSQADGSRARQLTHFNSGLASSPRWSPDGLRIVFDATIASNRDIYVIQADGGVPQRITRESSSEGQPSWSHDGRWIYFMSDRSGSQQIWKMAAGGGKPVQMTQQGGYQALESSDGKTLYYAKQHAGPGLWRVPVNGGQEKLVSNAVWQNLWAMADDAIFYFDINGLAPQVFEAPLNVPVARLSLADGKAAAVASILTDLPTGVPALEVRRDGGYLAWVTRRQHTSEIMLIRNLRLVAQ